MTGPDESVLRERQIHGVRPLGHRGARVLWLRSFRQVALAREEPAQRPIALDRR